MEFSLIRTNSGDPRFISLVAQLDKELKITDGEEHDFYNQFNGLENIKHILIAEHKNQVLGCGAFKVYDNCTVEIKRMYTTEKYRGRGIALKILASLEYWASELGYKKCILETGKRQTSAIKLYQKTGYQTIENYAQYKDLTNSVCFEKLI